MSSDQLSLPWKASLHGGHSGQFCDHAEGSLREILEAAVRFGYQTFGVTEHVPRTDPQFLYPNEAALGWTVETLAANFEGYSHTLSVLAEEFHGRLTVLRGFECEVVPHDGYLNEMRSHRAKRLPDGSLAFEYCVGSVHHVDGRQVDGPAEDFALAVRDIGGLEAFAVRYYETLRDMVSELKPEVVGHFDLVKRNVRLAGLDRACLDTNAVRHAALHALDVVREAGGILDLNTAGWRKGLGEPYPSPWLVQQAHARGIGFCFGDDSHRVGDVGAGLYDAATYLKYNGVGCITVLTREGADLIHTKVDLP